MEPLKRCVLLAIALLLVAVLAEESGCWRGGAECKVVREDELLVVECGALNLDQDTNETVETSSKNGSFNCTINDTWCHMSNTTVMNSDLHKVDSRVTEWQIKPNLVDSYPRSTNRFEKELLSRTEVNLLGDVSVMDFSYISSVKTVTLNTNGFNIRMVCGATNVSVLTVTSSSIIHNFVKCFTSLKSLNLSHNMLESFTVSEFPPTIYSVDLSFNKITLTKTVTFPHTLRLFNISYNNITNDKEFILKGNVIVLDIRENKLSHVPIIEMDALEELYLSHNQIKNLKEKHFASLLNLTILDLRANCLNNLEEKVFQGLNRLQWLDLSENNLMSLAPATFQYLSNLVTLLLSKNVNLGNLQNIEDASLIFGTGQRLQEIEASGTNLSRIPSTVTRSVRKLRLTDNTICTIQCGEVDSFPLLQIIDVSNNMISDIEEDALGRLEFLSELLLSRNKLSNIPKSLPGQLKVLDIRCNYINKLSSIDFLGLQKLRVLLLSMNNISVIEDGAFGQLISLDVLDLSYNPIKTLYRSSFTGPRGLKELYLVSLTEIIPLKEPLSFPAPESSNLEILNLDFSSELATRLMDDVAALTMFHELYELSLRDCRLQTLRNDLISYLPRLHKFDISNNPLNCTDIMWLIKWMHSRNANQETFGPKHGDIRYVSCRDVPKHRTILQDNVKCAYPPELAGRTILSLKEELLNFATPKHSTSRELISETKSTTETTQTVPVVTINPIVNRDVIIPPKLTRNLTSSLDGQVTSNPTKLTDVNNNTEILSLSMSNSTHFKQKDTNSQNAMNKLKNTWKYSKLQKYPSGTGPSLVLLNSSKHIVIDNQVNDSLISQRAFLAHEPPTSHPGMMVFLVVVGVIIIASSTMLYSHWRQLQRSSQYQHHQDIEVSSFGGHELW
ncbi:protein artichoke-like [Macrosteles quadrilineatus]|uniref:protein artichoke-like n=1 Tax=Macrosteles quadrilineatus TaxID=74068 RepID=UPI0023E0ED3C|nr:protein artichoke-like [Macrosteles quadrilineatus]